MTECYFTPNKETTSATICAKCGKEKMLHTIGEGIKASTVIISSQKAPEQGGETVSQKNISFAADAVAETIFYHFTDSANKEKLKTALKMFASMILLASVNNDKTPTP